MMDAAEIARLREIEQDAMNEYSEEEILRVSDQLGRSEHYGAAQMVCGLARERDQAQKDAKDARAMLGELRRWLMNVTPRPLRARIEAMLEQKP